MDLPLGQRIHVIGNSCAGKSTLAQQLSEILDLPIVELDALNWQPGWVGLNEHNPAEFERRIAQATGGDRWVVAGSYSAFSRRVIWPRLESMICLDLPRAQLVVRVLTRSWRRWRKKELLWGTNRESFWRQLMVWRKQESLIWWVVTQHARKRRDMEAMQSDPKCSHIQFIRLRSAAEVRSFLTTVAACAGSTALGR